MLDKIRGTFGSLLIMLCSPPFALMMWYTNTALDGSLAKLWQLIVEQGFFSVMYTIWQPVFWGSPLAWSLIAGFIVFEAVLLKCLPGKTFHGPISPMGNIPVYKSNGILAFLTTLAVFSLGSFGLQLFPASILYDNFGAILGALNLFSVALCALLYLKGRFMPSSTDSGISGNLVFDYYWGTELYPTCWGINLKMFINCRLGMMSWGLLLLSYAAKQQEWYGLSNSMLISVALQLIYICKFFIWETGYLSSLDIMHDRAGFYICWGCLVWVPCIYTSPTMYLVLHPNHLSEGLAILIFLLGVASIYINYSADKQRQRVRATAGDCTIWGKKPRTALATYYTESGEKKQNLLLSSGWWGITRHFHYLPEVAAAFFWSVPALFVNFSPWFYVCFLAILLTDRAFRDDVRCARKYGIYWQDYCRLVPYKVVPFVI